jgi:hypothetical protein
VNWTIGVSSTLDKAVAFARNERETYGLKDPPNDLPGTLSATPLKARWRTTVETHPVECPQDLMSINACPRRQEAICLRTEYAF